MGSRDWYRNTSWDDAIAATFQERLAGSRQGSRAEYLRIQISTLAGRHPRAALGLVDQLRALGETPMLAAVAVDEARAFAALGDTDAAVAAYERAVERERAFRQVDAGAALAYGVFIVEQNLVRLYPRALEVLPEGANVLLFAVTAFQACGARAIILDHLGRSEEARELARVAVTATRQAGSGFRYHRDVGLVRNLDTPFARRVAAIAALPPGRAGGWRGWLGAFASPLGYRSRTRRPPP